MLKSCDELFATSSVWLRSEEFEVSACARSWPAWGDASPGRQSGEVQTDGSAERVITSSPVPTGFLGVP